MARTPRQLQRHAHADWGRQPAEQSIAALPIMAQLAGLSICSSTASQTLNRCGQNGASCPPLCPPMPVEHRPCGSKRHGSSGRLLAATKEALTYKQAGVDISAGAELVRRIKKLNPAVGGFSGLFPFGDHYLVAGTDGVGTKLKLAFDLNKHDTIGIDLVAMSVNDIITCGAKPLFFLDYYATSALDVDVAEKVVAGIVEGCRQSDCQLLGGETAEMPGFYDPGEYDVAGFAVGSVPKNDVIDGSSIAAGDVLVGIPSSGLHSNGFSLARKIQERSGLALTQAAPSGFPGQGSLGEALLQPTQIYAARLQQLRQEAQIKGIVHVTGGGFYENIPRVIPAGLGCDVQTGSWDCPALFQWLQQEGNVADKEMFSTFNMGVGMVLIVSTSDADKLTGSHSDLRVIGHIRQGEGVHMSGIDS